MVVRYEDLKSHTEETIQRIATFVGRGELTTKEVQTVMELTSFEKMKEGNWARAKVLDLPCAFTIKRI